MNSARTAGLVLSVCVVAMIAGCAMMGGDENKNGDQVARIPRKKDTITMRNNDVLTGRLDLSVIEIKTDYLPSLSLKKDDIDTIEFFSDTDRVKLTTKSGDILRGTINVKKFRLLDSSLPRTPVVERGDIKYIHFR